MTSTIEIEVLVFRVYLGDRTPVRPENKHINVSDSSFFCHFKIVEGSQQYAICSVKKVHCGPCIRFRIKSYFCFCLCNEGLTSGPFVQLVTFYKVFGGMMGLAGFTTLILPSAVNRTHILTGMEAATTRISGGHLITMDSVSVREAATMLLDSTSQTATHWVVLRCSGAAAWSLVSHPDNPTNILS